MLFSIPVFNNKRYFIGHPVNCQTICSFSLNCQNILKTRWIVLIFTHNYANCQKIVGAVGVGGRAASVLPTYFLFTLFLYSHYVIFALCRITHLNGSFSHFVPLMVYLYTYTIKTPFWGKFERFTYALLHRYINISLFTYFSLFLYCFWCSRKNF